MPYLAMEWKSIRMILQSAVVIAVLIDQAAFQIAASDDVVFYEPFDDSFEGSWIASERDDYKGVWKLSKSEGHDDYGLLVSEKARKYAIVKELEETFNFKEGKAVLQFEVRLQNDLECGGAYLKYLRPLQDSWDPKNFDNNHPYSIMFGPDKCGSTNKVHFILNHRNPKTGKYVEHHLKYPPPLPSDKLTHVYTAALRPGNQLSILIDGKEKKKANFLSGEDFEPALVPSKMITDPNDKKPDDWDEQEKVPDSTAVKPDDWDEDAPMEIIDEAAEKPQGWLDKETEEIDDPQAVKPEDWDDEEDGEWEPPKMQNPKCVLAPGCGVWKKPMKRNPSYKGKWKAPLIDNPNYKGVWKPGQIPNPDYYELDKPDFEPVAAIGIEIWTMQDGILFDNILITREEKVADTYREKTWKPKYKAEKQQQKAQEAGSGLAGIISSFQEMLQKKIFDLLYRLAEIPLLDAYKPKIIDLIEKGNKQPHITIGVLASVVVVTLTAFFRLLFGDKKTKVVNNGKNKVVDAVSSNNQRSRGIKEKKAQSSDNQREKEKEPENEDAVAPRRRKSARRET